MGIGGTLAILLVLTIVGFTAFKRFDSRKEEAVAAHLETMKDIEAEKVEELEALDAEGDLYIRLFVIYSENHVKQTGRLISSNRLSPLEKEFREGYLKLLGKGLPEISAPYKRIKIALKAKDLMVK